MATTYRMTIGGATRTVEVGDEGGRLTVSIDGELLQTDLRRIEGSLLSLLLNGRSFEVVAVEIPTGYEVSIAHEIFDVEVERGDLPRAAVGSGAAVAAGPSVVKAPLTGTVIEVTVAVGEEVAAGQVLVVVESMKMNNELRAPRPGTVRAVHVKAGDRVERDMPLIALT